MVAKNGQYQLPETGIETMATEFSESFVTEIEGKDHRVFVVAADEWISDEVETHLEAEGYVFVCSPENPDGTRRVYFARG
jgi:hypothetical protein